MAPSKPSMTPSHLLWHRLAEGLSTSLRLAFASPPHFYGFYKNRTQKKETRDRGRSLKTSRGLTFARMWPKQTPKHVLVKCPKPQNASCARFPRQVSAEGGKSHADSYSRSGAEQLQHLGASGATASKIVQYYGNNLAPSFEPLYLPCYG